MVKNLSTDAMRYFNQGKSPSRLREKYKNKNGKQSDSIQQSDTKLKEDIFFFSSEGKWSATGWYPLKRPRKHGRHGKTTLLPVLLVFQSDVPVACQPAKKWPPGRWKEITVTELLDTVSGDVWGFNKMILTRYDWMSTVGNSRDNWLMQM